MRQSFLFAFVCILYCLSGRQVLIAQISGQEWINMNQTYLKIPVAETGMYRITPAMLTNAGVTGINPKRFQIIHRGKEQAIHVEGEADDSFDANDYIDFYGKKNDGSRDTELYRNSSDHLNHHYSLYTDTTAYFFTWKLDNTNGLRATQVNNALPTNPAYEAYHWQKQVTVHHAFYAPGQNHPEGSSTIIYLSQFDTGEGWSSNICYANVPNYDRVMTILPFKNTYTANPNLKARLKISLAGASNTAVGLNNQVIGYFDLRIGNSPTALVNFQTGVETSFNKTKIVEFDIPFSYLTTGENLYIEAIAKNGHFVVAYMELSYPQQPTMPATQNLPFSLRANANEVAHLEFASAPANMKLYEMDKDKGLLKQFAGTISAGKFQTTINQLSEDKTFMADAGARLTPISLKPVTFKNFNPALYDYVILTSERLRKPAGGFPDIVQAYADYRATPTGQNYKPVVVDIEWLYEQFNYGEKTPVSVRNFMAWFLREGQPKHLFIIGLGLSFPDPKNYTSLFPRQVPAHQALNFVPVFNFPVSDVAWLEKLNGTGGNEPSISVGRIGVVNPEQILNYFNKVKEHELVENELWQKNMIHLVGGRYEWEQTLFTSFMKLMKDIAENQFLAGKVKTINKRTTGITEAINISEQINQGVSVINFFGHSDLEGTDVEIGRCSDDIQGYKNKGKYPLMLVNGCNLGGVFYGRGTLAGDWLYTKDRGALAFIGHTYFGYSNVLRDYSTQLYQVAFQDVGNLKKPIGSILREHVKQNTTSLSPPDLSVGQQMLLQGDPALIFFKANKPDYFTASDQMTLASFDNNPVTALTDSFKLKVIVSNLGITTLTKLGVKIKRTFPNGTQTVIDLPAKFNSIYFQDTLTFTLKKQAGVESFGNNVFEVILDYENTIDEMRENNNIGILSFFMPAMGVIPTLPQEYSIVNEQPLTLSAATTNGINEGRDFVFEIDTTRTFNSPYKRSQIIPATVSPSWEINSLITNNDTDSTVYYWRVNYADAINDPNALWGYSSFTYIKNSPEGWTQRDFPQFLRNNLSQIVRNNAERKWEFDEITKRIRVQTFGSTNPTAVGEVAMLYEEVPQVFAERCGTDVIVCMTFKQTDGAAERIFDNACGRQPETANSYTNAQVLNGALHAYLDNVTNGDFVLFFTKGNINFNTWTTTQTSAFQRIGGNPVIYNSLKTGHPYIILGRKGGALGTAEEAIALNISNPTAEAIKMETRIRIPYYTGTVSSTRVGPSIKWKEFKQRIAKTSPTSTYKANIYGVSLQGVENPVPLFENVTLSNLNLSTVNATQYPYLRLAFQTQDLVGKKAPTQLKNWLVLYDGVPDGMIDIGAIGQSAYVISPKEEGQNFELEFAFKNLTGLTFSTDSLTVQFTRRNLTNLNQEVRTIKIKAPLAKETVKFKRSFTTQGWGGKNELKVYVNPQLVPERYYENNVFLVNFEVIPDDNNPLLEVAFDGRKILNGEIVSASPLITVQLYDNNRHILADKPSNLQVSLKKPGVGQPYENIDVTNPDVAWSYQAGKLRINIKRENLPSGIYTLRAQGVDGVGNVASTDPYQIDFEVVRESTVTNVLPYPNPFSTSTRFVFTLTGDQIPDEMKIQVMTIAGKVVREISHLELGNIRVGNNISEYAWDGTDEFGEKLANGVYLYKVIMKKAGKVLEHRATSMDKGFKHGVGKLYIAR